MPSLTRITTGGVLNPLKNTTKIGHNKLLHQEPLQPPLEPRKVQTKEFVTETPHVPTIYSGPRPSKGPSWHAGTIFTAITRRSMGRGPLPW